MTPQPVHADDALYAMALSRLAGLNLTNALLLYRHFGDARQVYEHRNHLEDNVENCQPRLAAALKDWGDALRRAESELEFANKHGVQVLTPASSAYPARLRDCPDAPVVLYYRGTADLNATHIVSIVGTRHCTAYGHDLVKNFMAGLRQSCPDAIIVSGLAYGVDISAHRQALAQGMQTVGVLAHGIDELYPPQHRETARAMINQGGILTEYMTQTRADKVNFVKRNRIVAGMADATILIESAAKGGGLITMRIANSYSRQVFAFPGAVGAPYSEGCNNLIRDNVAALITSADDFTAAMGWQEEAEKQKTREKGIERQLFPQLTDDERAVVELLQKTNDLQLNTIAVKANIAVPALAALLFSLEMKGLVRPLAGGTYHLYNM